MVRRDTGEDERVRRLAGLVPVVVVSMSGSQRVAALAAGSVRFVEKDGDATALVAAIRSIADEEAGSLSRMSSPRQNALLDGEQHEGATASDASEEEGC